MDCFNQCYKDGIVTISCLPCFIQNISSFLFSSVAAVAVIYSLFAAWKFVISQGDAQKVAEARKTLTFALAGLAVVLLSYFAIKTLSQILGIDLL
ncbi:hypothetical protein HY384_03080 [Candidatus Daviesbacteria bacterium]|nr:hypothetical protein [Candidatus Daviesbacteria bacterium]